MRYDKHVEGLELLKETLQFVAAFRAFVQLVLIKVVMEVQAEGRCL